MSRRALTPEQTDLMIELARIGAGVVELEDAAHRMLSALIDHLSFQHGSIHQLSDRLDEFEVLAQIGEARLALPAPEELMDPETDFQKAMQSGKGRVVYRTIRQKGTLIEVTRFTFPLLHQNRAYGVVTLLATDGTNASEGLLDTADVLGPWMGELLRRVGEVTQLVRRENEIRRLSKFPRENPNPLFCCNRRGDVTYLNQAMLDLLKGNRLGKVKNIKELFSDGGKSFSHICRSVGEDIISKNREFRIGSRILLGSVSSYKGAEDSYVYLQDITELKTLAQEMARKNMELTEIKEELEYQTRRAMDANRHKSEFLANMSHELRTPLNAVIGFSEVLLDELFGPLNPKQREYTTDILESGRHLLSLINDILDLSKIEAGKMELELSEFAVRDLVQMSSNLMKEKASKHGISVSIEVEEAVGTLVADERKIKQVVFNLISNSLKFTPDHGKMGIRVSRDGDFVKFCVWDSGIGISIDEQERIFEEFHQVDGSLTKRYEGAGLGLAIVKKFVQLHGGKVWVESKLNLGSRFYFTIPLTAPKWLATPQPAVQ
ncbi:MAG: hypothetical protein C4523_17650 [Myxococcales bacterium]|nr:MAG: hypothetical protein C4523_17650 [Myxococcales bacterium]